MSNEVTKAQPAPGAVAVPSISDKDLLKHLSNMGLLPKLNEGERDTYLQIAKAFNLNPFKREIYVSKYGDQMSIITGYEVYIKRGERTGQLDGWSVITEGTVKDNNLKAVLTIHRKDRKHPFIWEVFYSEYVQMKEGQPNKFWKKAHTMIKKVAISQGFRLCFSDELGGMPYSQEEIGVEDANYTLDTTGIESTETAKTPVDKVTPAAGNGAAALQMKDGKPMIANEQLKNLIERVKAGDTDAYDKAVSFFSFEGKQLQVLDEMLELGKAAKATVTDSQPPNP